MKGFLHRGLAAGIVLIVFISLMPSELFASPSDEALPEGYSLTTTEEQRDLQETETAVEEEQSLSTETEYASVSDDFDYSEGITVVSEVRYNKTYGAFNTNGHYLGEFLGITRTQLVNSMNSLEASHGNNYYLNTRYYFSDYMNDLIWPKGKPRSDGHTGFNCAGFVARAVMDAGGDLTELNKYGSPSRGASGADCWVNYVLSKGIMYYKYASLEAMLADGRAEKGDIIFTYPVEGFLPGSRDTHLGIYWGSYPGENLMWQSINATPGNLIMQCLTGAPLSDVYLFKLGNGRTYDWKYYNGKWYLSDYAGVWQKGWVKVKGYWYYFDSSGAMLSGWQKIGGNWYCLGGANDGHMYTGWQKISGKWYYMDTSSGIMATGWKKIKGYWYLFDSNGVMQSGWQKIGGKWYLLGSQSDGHMFTGFQKIGGKWYYFDLKTGEMATGWKSAKGEWYLFDSNGVMQSGWQKIGNNWYLLGGPEDGHMLTGFQKVGSNWYFFNGSGEMMTGWQYITIYWYYFGDDGIMQTGWKNFDDTWYFLKPDGSQARGEWLSGYWFNKDGSWTYQPRGKWRKNATGWWYGDTSGWYAKNTTLKINDSYYKFNAAGYWVSK